MAHFSVRGTDEVDEQLVVETEAKALRFCTQALELAKKYERGSLEFLWSAEPWLRESYETIFSPPFAKLQGSAHQARDGVSGKTQSEWKQEFLQRQRARRTSQADLWETALQRETENAQQTSLLKRKRGNDACPTHTELQLNNERISSADIAAKAQQRQDLEKRRGIHDKQKVDTMKKRSRMQEALLELTTPSSKRQRLFRTAHASKSQVSVQEKSANDLTVDQTASKRESLSTCADASSLESSACRSLKAKTSSQTLGSQATGAASSHADFIGSREIYQGYFETQSLARCGMHALNNALGMDFVSHEDMTAACDNYLREAKFEGMRERRSMHEHPGVGWYSEAVMAYVLRWKQNIYTLDVDNPIHVDDERDPGRLFGEEVKGVVVNKQQSHWIAFRFENGKIWLLDSTDTPQVYTYPEYVAFRKNYRQAFVVRTLI